jgi:hypothetical protein
MPGSAPACYFACRRCGERLFDGTSVTHESLECESAAGAKDAGPAAAELVGLPPAGAAGCVKPVLGRKEWRRESWVSASAAAGTGCTSVFIGEPPGWEPCEAGNEGRFSCPKCESKVGSYLWSGASCSCGEWITPSFQFHLARVDRKGTVAADLAKQQRAGAAGVYDT